VNNYHNGKIVGGKPSYGGQTDVNIIIGKLDNQKGSTIDSNRMDVYGKISNHNGGLIVARRRANDEPEKRKRSIFGRVNNHDGGIIY